MATDRTKDTRCRRTKPWMARRKRNGIDYVLGFYATKEEAEEREREFDDAWPTKWGWNKGLRRILTSTGHYIYE